MTIKFKDKDLELHYSLRIYIIYENVVGDSLNAINPNSITSTTSLIYATIASTLKHNGMDDTLTLDDVINIIDENGGMGFITTFSQWFTDKVNAEADLVAKINQPDIKKKQRQKQKSNG